MKNLVLLDGSKERVIVNVNIKYIRVRSIKIVQFFVALVKLEYVIWDSVCIHGRFIVGIHGNSELNGNINECQNVLNVIWVVEKS